MTKKYTPEDLTWPRSDPAALAKWDERTKLCTMNCGQHCLDPRSRKEMMYQCPECIETPILTEGELHPGDAFVHSEDGTPWLMVKPRVLIKVPGGWEHGVIYSAAPGNPNRNPTELYVRPDLEFRQKFKRVPKP